MLPATIEYDHQITLVDTEQWRPGMAACYLIGDGDDYAFIECGTSLSIPGLLELLAARNIDRAQIRYVLPTHVHLDHAGGAGLLMQACPNAQLVIHPRGARHMIDPAALINGASAVYGEQGLRDTYGEILPVPAERVIEAPDRFHLKLGHRELEFVDAPGHARHHYVIWDARSRGFFTGDVFGISYREFDTRSGSVHLMPTTSPVQFDPQAWEQTLRRMESYVPQWMYLTHYGRIGQLPTQFTALRAGLAAYAAMAQRLRGHPDRRNMLKAALTEYEVQRLQAMQAPVSPARARELLTLDMDLDAQGLGIWLDKLP